MADKNVTENSAASIATVPTSEPAAAVQETRKHVSHETFVREWRAAKSRAEFAKKVGLSDGAINLRAKKLRDLGVTLENHGRVSQEIDVAALNAIAPVITSDSAKV